MQGMVSSSSSSVVFALVHVLALALEIPGIEHERERVDEREDEDGGRKTADEDAHPVAPKVNLL